MIRFIDENHGEQIDFEDLEDFRERINEFISSCEEHPEDNYEIKIKDIK